MNDSSTIYISHSEDISSHHVEEEKLLSSTVSSNILDKKVAQNRAAQRAFRERKQHYVQDLENKAKQLDMWKRAMIQLQADNDCLRKTVARLEDQMKQFIVAASTSVTLGTGTSSSSSSSLSSPSSTVLPSSSSTLSSASSALQISTVTPSESQSSNIPTSLPSSLPSSPSSPSLSSSSSSSSTLSLSSLDPNNNNNNNKRKPTLSKREKKRQRLLADEKLYKNDDLEPIQLHCPLAFNSITIQQSSPPVEKMEPYLDPFLPSSPPSSVVATDIHPLAFTDLPSLDHSHDQYINFADDDFPSSSSSSSSSSICSSSYVHLG